MSMTSYCLSWFGDAAVKMLDLQSRGCGFDFGSGH